MKLTGKCNEDFEKWYKKRGELKLQGRTVFSIEIHFIPFVMRYALYQDFFDVERLPFGNYWCFFSGPEHSFKDHFGKRQEAREKAIEHANKIYNER